MSLVDPIADALINIKNNDNASKKVCMVRPASKLLGEILRIFKEYGYISNFEKIEDGRENIYRIELEGKINDCKAIKPRYAVKKDEFERFEKRYLPSRDIGLIVVSTPQGVMAHVKAKESNTGGRLLAYVF